MVPDPRDEGKETVFTISGGGDGGVKDQDQDQDQDVASVSKTDNKSIGGGNVLSLQRKIQYFIKSTTTHQKLFKADTMEVSSPNQKS